VGEIQLLLDEVGYGLDLSDLCCTGTDKIDLSMSPKKRGRAAITRRGGLAGVGGQDACAVARAPCVKGICPGKAGEVGGTQILLVAFKTHGLLSIERHLAQRLLEGRPCLRRRRAYVEAFQSRQR